MSANAYTSNMHAQQPPATIPMTGRLIGVSSYNFPTPYQTFQAGTSPTNGQNLSVLSTEPSSQTSLLSLVIQSTLGTSLSTLKYEGRNLIEFLPVEGCFTLRVRIWNIGPSAFEPETYGDFITVERELSKAKNVVRLCNQEHEVCSPHEEDLERMLFQLNIHLKHPTLFVGRDLAGLVLEGDALALYKLALRSSELQECRHECLTASHNFSQERASKRKLQHQLEKMKQAHAVCKQFEEEIARKQQVPFCIRVEPFAFA